MINANRKWLKIFLVLGFTNIDFFVALIFGICVKFLDKFIIVLLAILLLLSTTLLLLALNIFRANCLNNLIVFNKKINGAAILLKLYTILIKIRKTNKYLNILYYYQLRLIFDFFNLFIFYPNFLG